MSTSKEYIRSLFNVFQCQIVRAKNSGECLSLCCTTVKLVNIFASEKSASNKAWAWKALSVTSWKKLDKKSSRYNKSRNRVTWLVSVILGLELEVSVVVNFMYLVMTAGVNVQESAANNKAVFDYKTVIVTSRTAFARNVGWIGAAVKLNKVVRSAIVWKSIARCACRHNSGSSSSRTRESARTIKLNLLALIHVSDSGAWRRVEKLCSARTDEQRLWLAWF